MSWGDVHFDDPKKDDFVALLRRSLGATHVVGRVLLVYVVVVIPAVSFLITWDHPPQGDDWQSGSLYAWLSFLLTVRAGFVFFPLMAYSMACFLLVLFQRDRFENYFAVRLGVYGGVVLGLHYGVLLAASLSQATDWRQVAVTLPFHAMFAGITGLAGLAIVKGLAFTLRLLEGWLGMARLWVGLSLIALACLMVGILNNDIGAVFAAPVGIVFVISLLCGPYWFLAAYVYMSISLARQHWEGGQFRMWQLMTVFTWLAGYLAACRAAVNLAMIEYQKLPTEAPEDCYIATAAAQGHRDFVGSWRVETVGGKEMCVNRQLQIFKCGEIALRSLFPQLHRGLRFSYDRIGPHVAKTIRHPLLADLAFLSLKPLEWVTMLSLSWLIPNFRSQAVRLYANQHRSE